MDYVYDRLFELMFSKYIVGIRAVYKNIRGRVWFIRLANRAPPTGKVRVLANHYPAFALLAPGNTVWDACSNGNWTVLNQWTTGSNARHLTKVFQHSLSDGTKVGNLVLLMALANKQFDAADFVYSRIGNEPSTARNYSWDDLFYRENAKAVEWLYENRIICDENLKNDHFMQMIHRSPFPVFEWVMERVFEDDLYDPDMVQDALDLHNEQVFRWYLAHQQDEVLESIYSSEIFTFSSADDVKFVHKCLMKQRIDPCRFFVAGFEDGILSGNRKLVYVLQTLVLERQDCRNVLDAISREMSKSSTMKRSRALVEWVCNAIADAEAAE